MAADVRSELDALIQQSLDIIRQLGDLSDTTATGSSAGIKMMDVKHNHGG